MSRETYEGIELGLTTKFTKTVTEADVWMFAGVSGDFNPLHVDKEYAKKSMFGQRVAHGILSLAFISASLAKLPGDVIYLSQSCKFTKPVMIGDTITARSKVIEKIEKHGFLKLGTTCENQNGETVLEGEAQVKIDEPHT